MKRGFICMAVFAIAAGIFWISTFSTYKKSTDNILPALSDTGFVVMELFTSQGCSSCPPADELLGIYAAKNDSHIISLAFHVDYWNRLGWVDSFSSNLYSTRQRDYAEKFNAESVYTPQLIINGKKQIVGSDRSKSDIIINDFLKEKASVTIKATVIRAVDNKIQVDYVLSKVMSNTVINAALVQENIVTQVKAGENQGRKLTNYNVVRNFKTIQSPGTSGEFILEFPKGNMQGKYQVILFTQDNISGAISGAAKLSCNL